MTVRLYVVALMFLVQGLFAVADDKITVDQAIQLVAQQQDDDPVIGVWSGSAGGYSWKTAIVKNPVAAKDGYEFIGIMLRPWPTFRKGETILKLRRTSSAAIYEGVQKWKTTLFTSSWSPAEVVLVDSARSVQSNNIRFETPIGSVWNMSREAVQRSPQPLRSTAGVPRVAAITATSGDLATAEVFVWFDEPAVKPGVEVLEIVTTVRAYDGALDIIRQARAGRTELSCSTCVNILETSYHPPTYRLGEWFEKQPSAERIASLFYWEDEVLGETTPVMNFYMTRRAYENVMLAVQQHFRHVQANAATPEKKSKTSRFLSVLGFVAQGALQGMANYYTTIKPAEDARRAEAQAAQAQRSLAYSIQQQTWEMQRLNQQLDQANTQAFLNRLQRDGDQYRRALARYTTGSWR